jgi:Fe-S cluster biogenesis protein NfuA
VSATEVEARLAELERLPDRVARTAATDAIAALLELYGDGLRRLLELEPGLAERAAGDEVVAQLLLIHGLHPVPVQARVEAALDEVRPYLRSHGGGVELIDVREGVVHLRLEGSCNGCPSSSATLRSAVDAAIQRAAPDVEGIEAEGAAPTPDGGLLQIECPLP